MGILGLASLYPDKAKFSSPTFAPLMTVFRGPLGVLGGEILVR
jgi:hypothetical protein